MMGFDVIYSCMVGVDMGCDVEMLLGVDAMNT